MKAAVIAAALLLLGAAARAEDDEPFAAPDRSVTLDAQSRARLGIVTVPARASEYRAQVTGLGQVLAVDALAQTDTDLTVAESAARASDAALARAEGLYKADTGVSRQVLETAQHQAATDDAQLALAQRKAMVAWGHDGPWRDAAKRHALLGRIASGDAVLIRATLPPGIETPNTMRVERLGQRGPDRGWAASAIWPAPADPALPGRSYLLLIEGAKLLAQGDRVRVIADSGERTKGAIVPNGAVVIAEGQTWLYIEEKPNYFVRQAIDVSKATGGGYFAPQGVSPGEAVVTEGAGQLLAKETGTGTED